MTDTIKPDEVVLKTDVLGRVRTPGARRESLIQEFERSGLSGAKFAALVGVKYSIFASCLQNQWHRRSRDHLELRLTARLAQHQALQ
jgi:hypothetical protein